MSASPASAGSAPYPTGPTADEAEQLALDLGDATSIEFLEQLSAHPSELGELVGVRDIELPVHQPKGLAELRRAAVGEEAVELATVVHGSSLPAPARKARHSRTRACPRLKRSSSRGEPKRSGERSVLAGRVLTGVASGV
jgi:hypothetical protein